MICPECLTKYREGFVECADCHVPLTDRLSEPQPEDHTGEGDLDVLIRTCLCGPLAISLVKGLFDEAGIRFFVMDQNTTARQEGGNFFGWFDVRVPHDREADAREILQSVAEMKDATPPAEPAEP